MRYEGMSCSRNIVIEGKDIDISRREEAVRQAQAVEASYTDYDYAEGSYSQGKLLLYQHVSLKNKLADTYPDVSQAASPEPSMTDYQNPPAAQQSYSQSYSQAGYTADTTATTQPGYHQDQYYQQPPTPWQGQNLPYGTDSAFQQLSIDAPAGPSEDPWQYDSYAYGAEDPIVFTGWMDHQQPPPGPPPHGHS